MSTKAEQLRAEILAKTAEYYKLDHEPKQTAEFVPGTSRVNYAGRVSSVHSLVPTESGARS